MPKSNKPSKVAKTDAFVEPIEKAQLDEISEDDIRKEIESNGSVSTKAAIATTFSVEGMFIHVKVGDAQRTATDDDIKDISNKLDELFDKHNVNCIAFVTHHAVDVTVIG